MKLARIILASAALLSVAACSSDSITAPSRPAPPAQVRASLLKPDTVVVPGLDGTPLQTCITTTVVVNGVTSAVTTCENGQLGSGQ